MTVKFVSFSPDDANLPWELWTPEPCMDWYRANFYTPTEPFLRTKFTITSMDMAESAEQKARAEGYVTLPELSEDVVNYWAESDATWLAYSVLSHLANRDSE